MKKLFSLMAVLLGISGAAIAQNALVVEEATLPQSGGEMNITLTLGEAGVYNAYQFKIDTPDGIVYDVDENNDVECTLVTGHHSSYQATAHWNPSTKVFALGVASMKSSLLEGTTVQLSIPMGATTAAVGSVFQLKFNDITFIRSEGEPDVLDDVYVSITIGEPDDGRIKFYETAARLPKYTAGGKGNVKMTRTIKANEWSTIVLPFTLTKAKAEAAFGSDVELAEFSGFEVDYGDDEENVIPLGITINLATYTMSTKKSMTGGKPFLIRTSQDIESFEADDVTLVDAVTDVNKPDEFDTPGKLTGTFVKTVIPEDGLFLSGNQFWYSVGKTNVKAFRCWFELGAVLDKETDFGSRIALNFVDDETTGVRNIKREAMANDRYYNLSGQRVEKPAKGIYVKEGKKIVVK